jgi:hypothetical protein
MWIRWADWKREARNPQFREKFREMMNNNWGANLNYYVDDVAKQLGLDSDSAFDRQLQFFVMSHVLCDPSDRLMGRFKKPGNRPKWDTKPELLYLLADIGRVWDGKRLSWGKLAGLLKERFPSNPNYKPEQETLEKQLQKRLGPGRAPYGALLIPPGETVGEMRRRMRQKYFRGEFPFDKWEDGRTYPPRIEVVR